MLHFYDVFCFVLFCKQECQREKIQTKHYPNQKKKNEKLNKMKNRNHSINTHTSIQTTFERSIAFLFKMERIVFLSSTNKPSFLLFSLVFVFEFLFYSLNNVSLLQLLKVSFVVIDATSLKNEIATERRCELKMIRRKKNQGEGITQNKKPINKELQKKQVGVYVFVRG